MSKISKYVKIDKDILLEYVYDDSNLLGEQYNILIDSRTKQQSFVSGTSSVTGNTTGNQLFLLDNISRKYGKLNTTYYSFLQLKEYASGIPIRFDTLRLHIPINWTFGEYLGFYVKIYAYNTSNTSTYDLSNFYFDMTDISQQYLLNFTSPPLLFQEKMWGKNITIQIPSLSAISSQKTNNLPIENSINSNLTNGSGLNITSPIFIDFHFITNIQTINGITNYILSSKITTTIPQSPEFERLGLMINHSSNGDFFEIYGTYNNTISGFSQFIEESYNIGHRYYVQYNITTYEQNIRGKTITITQYENFNETVEYRPIIKYSTTTAIIDVEMRLIDQIDNSYIIRRASYGLLQDEVSKYSLNLMKINLVNASKPKIYNVKSNIDPSLIGLSNSMGNITKLSSETGLLSNNTNNYINNNVAIETVKIPYPVLVDRFNIICKSENTIFNQTEFFGIGKIQIILYPFDNIIRFTIASGDPLKPDYLNMTGYGEIKLIFKNDNNIYEFPLYTESGSVDLSIGQISFKISQNKYSDIKRIYNTGINVFYITSLSQGINSVIYSGLYKIYDNIQNISNLNIGVASDAKPFIIKDNNITQETAIVTRRPITTESKPIIKPGSSSNIKKSNL